METVGGLAGLILAVVVVALGAYGHSWWVILPAAIAGMLCYVALRPNFIATIQRGGGLGLMLSAYIAQVVTMGILFGIGVLIGKVL